MDLELREKRCWRTLTRGVFAVGALLLAMHAPAEYPERPIRLILSSAAGASSDVVSRILATELVKQMGQQIVIDNRPGAVQTIGTAMVVRAVTPSATPTS